jgi:hypothetical protein
MPGGAGAAVQWRRRSGPRRRCHRRGAILGGRAPQAPRPGRGRAAQGCSPGARSPDAGQAGRCPVRLVRSAVGCPSNRSSGRPVSTRPVSRCPGHPGVRTDRLRCPRRCRRPVRALDPGVARCGGPPWPGAAGRRAPWPVGGVVACLHRAGREGVLRRWPWLARMRSTVARAAAWSAFRLRRRLGPSGPTRALVQGQGAGPDGGGARDRAGVHRPRRASWAGRRRGADQGAWTKGGDHAEWSLGERWSGGGELRRAHPFGGGSSLRPRRGRSA